MSIFYHYKAKGETLESSKSAVASSVLFYVFCLIKKDNFHDY